LRPIEHAFDTVSMSTERQKLSSALHGEALLQARRPELEPLIAELKAVAAGRDDIRVECAGILAGSWFASPATSYAHDLIAAGLLMAAGPVGGDELVRWLRVGFQRRQASSRSYDPSR
jgi:hypothetical protein